MPYKILELLGKHDFLKRALQDKGPELRPFDAARLKRECDQQILHLLKHPSDDPRVTLAQVKCLVRALAGLASTTEAAKHLSDLCLKAIARLERLAGAIAPSSPAKTLQRAAKSGQPKLSAPPASQDYALLDTLSDRVVVMDRAYHYVFCNRANAAFHGREPGEMIGRPVWSFVGNTCFSNLTKPKLDECFSGQSFTLYTRHIYRAPTITTSVVFQPIRNTSGEVVSAIVSARDVSALKIPDTQVWRVASLR